MRKEAIVLYADDDADDRGWITEACKSINNQLRLQFFETGKEVLDYLDQFAINALPSLIVLDLNMPVLDGKQTLQRLKTHPVYHHIPVVIVTTSSNKMDLELCKRLGASLFLTKPDLFKDWEHIVQRLEEFVK
ncbi:MAG TPA: response regulator [Flavisolibacter sp.]|nr:response regulator [Flavisolibacter sp.]